MKTSHLGAQYSDGRITPLHKPTVLVCAVFLRGSMKKDHMQGWLYHSV